ncbi:MAG: flippase [Ignavibacteriales bacterium]|nr:flippase [Ignavibacteriales bacterium]
MSIEVAKSVTKNAAVLMGSQAITWTMSFVLMLFLPRYLGSANYGYLYLANSIIGIFIVFIDFGGRYSIAKEISRSPDLAASIVVNGMGIRFIFWIISVVVLVIFIMIAGYPQIVNMLLLLFILNMLWEGMRKVLWSYFQGTEQMRYPSLGSISEQIFITFFTVSLLLSGAGVFVIGIVYTLGTFINFFIHAKYARKLITPLPAYQYNESVKLIKKGIPYFLWSIFGIIYYRVDAIMLSFLTPASVVGWYGAAYRFFDVLMFIPSIFSIAVFPVLSRLWKSKDTLAVTTIKSIDFIVIAGIPVTIGLYYFAKNITQLFYGLEGYAPSVLILQIFSIGILLVYIDMILGTAILASDKQRQWSIVALFAVIINVALNYLIIPYTQNVYHNGGIGSAIATIITEFFVMVCALLLIPKNTFENSKISITLKAVSSGIIMAISIKLMQLILLPWILQGILASIIYIASLLLLKTLEPDELEFFKNYISLKNIKQVFLPSKGKQ